MFRQEVPDIGLSVEQGTSSVPDDGRFHVVVDGRVVFSSKMRSAALTRYRRLSRRSPCGEARSGVKIGLGRPPTSSLLGSCEAVS
jgi:hypothetical protein